MIQFKPAYMTPPKFSVSNFNLATIVCRPYWLISGYLFNVLVCVIFANTSLAASDSLVSGTYIAVYFDGDYLVIGGDSRGTQLELNSISDNVCKIIPLSKQVIFFAIGITVGKGFNARDIAQNVARFVGSDDKINEMGDQWGRDMILAFEGVSISHASTLIDHNDKRTTWLVDFLLL